MYAMLYGVQGLRVFLSNQGMFVSWFIASLTQLLITFNIN